MSLDGNGRKERRAQGSEEEPWDERAVQKGA